MKSTVSLSVCALAALVAAVAGTVACSSDNEPSTPSTSTTPDDEDDGTGGDEGGDSTATGGATTTGTGGGTPASSDTATGGEPAAGGATTGASGAASTAAAGAAATSTGEYTPLTGADCVYPTESLAPPDDASGPCLAGESKNATCPAEQEGVTCYKSCGPRNSSGWKPLTCTAGVITEDSTCRWTGTDYAVWRVPATLEGMDPACPAEGTPRATDPCDVPSCISCANRTTGGYEDSSGAAKGGWCTCVGDEGDRQWTCGTAGKAWPCPGQPGC